MKTTGKFSFIKFYVKCLVIFVFNFLWRFWGLLWDLWSLKGLMTPEDDYRKYEEPYNKPSWSLMDLTLGRRTSLLDRLRTLGGGCRGMRMWESLGGQNLNIRPWTNCLGPWKKRTLEKSPLKVKLEEDFTEARFEGMKKGLEEFIHSFVHSLITVYWLPPTCQNLF